ncbi:hypothetical protein EC957_007366 [Mortierella hygrophila]|uniref:Uncharacterized protein n=1 Tax=Mortierella hygrophila TaxID=979708 RepID=A0A9P6EX99_9FUNG|nr:hypothetical protein EC957_007366 [Mortierella hygrophila]
MSRLKALFSPRRRTAVPVSRTTQHRRRRPVRQPVRKTGGFGLSKRSRRTRRTVATPQRRRGGLFASLKPRRHYGRTRTAHDSHHHQHPGKFRTFAGILALLSLKKKHDHHKKAKAKGVRH